MESENYPRTKKNITHNHTHINIYICSNTYIPHVVLYTHLYTQRTHVFFSFHTKLLGCLTVQPFRHLEVSCLCGTLAQELSCLENPPHCHHDIPFLGSGIPTQTFSDWATHIGMQYAFILSLQEFPSYVTNPNFAKFILNLGDGRNPLEKTHVEIFSKFRKEKLETHMKFPTKKKRPPF